jgi:hypothetical protein
MIFGATLNRVLDPSLTTVMIDRKMTNKNNIEKLQKDLDSLGGWRVENGVKINRQ